MQAVYIIVEFLKISLCLLYFLQILRGHLQWKPFLINESSSFTQKDQ